MQILESYLYCNNGVWNLDRELKRLLLQNGYPQGIITFNINDVLNKNKPNEPVATVPKKDVIVLLPHTRLHSNLITKLTLMLIMSTLLLMLIKVIFQNTRRIKSFFPYKDRLNRSELSKVICKGNCWDCKDFYIGKTKRRLYDRKTEHFKALLKHDHSSTIADHVKTTGHNIKWDHFDTLASGKTDYYCKVKETLFIQELQPAVKSFYSIKEAFLLSLYRQFLFEMS